MPRRIELYPAMWYFRMMNKYLVKLWPTVIGIMAILPFTGTAQIPAYYTNVDLSLSGIELRDALSTKLESSTYINYTSSGSFDTWDALRITDENPSSTSEVLLIYGWESGQDGDVSNDRERGKFENGQGVGLWNREHVFPRSLAVPALTVDDPGPGTDFHNLRPCDMQTNMTRGNLKFIDGSGNAGINSSGWYPGDEWKGDVARIVMYMYLRYDGNGSSVGQTRCLPTAAVIGTATSIDPNMVALLLQWNAADPVSALEQQRNAVAEQYQNNRNPFIDNASLAYRIWGGPVIDDPWNLDGNTEFDFSPSATVLSNGVLLQWNPWPNAIGCEVKGGPIGANDPFRQVVQGFEPSGLFVPKNQLAPQPLTYQWRIRCVTGVNPFTGVSPNSEYHYFTFSP